MSTNELAQYEYCQETGKLKVEIEKAFLALGERLMNIRDRGLFLSVSCDTFQDYLDEIKIHKTVASKLIRIYQKLHIEYGISRERLAEAGGWSVVAEILPAVKSKEDAERLIDIAVREKRPGLRQFLTEERTGIDMRTCPHEQTYLLTVCKVCGIKIKNHEENTNSEENY